MRKPSEIAYELLNLSQKEKEKYFIKLLNKKFIVHPNVFSPKFFNDTELFARYFPHIKKGTMLEIGTGIGAIAIFAILNGKMKKVIATDINQIAVKNAKENVQRYGLERKIRVIKSNMFEKFKKSKFDIIFFNAPFCFTKKKKLTVLEKALFDYNYKTLRRFIHNCKNHIRKNGHIFLGFSSFFGDFNKLTKIANHYNRRIKMVKSIVTKRKGQKVRLEILEII
mgnify:FL=1